MDADFWEAKWEKGEIAFHEREANPLLEGRKGVRSHFKNWEEQRCLTR